MFQILTNVWKILITVQRIVTVLIKKLGMIVSVIMGTIPLATEGTVNVRHNTSQSNTLLIGITTLLLVVLLVLVVLLLCVVYIDHQYYVFVII